MTGGRGPKVVAAEAWANENDRGTAQARARAVAGGALAGPTRADPARTVRIDGTLGPVGTRWALRSPAVGVRLVSVLDSIHTGLVGWLLTRSRGRHAIEWDVPDAGPSRCTLFCSSRIPAVVTNPFTVEPSRSVTDAWLSMSPLSAYAPRLVSVSPAFETVVALPSGASTDT